MLLGKRREAIGTSRRGRERFVLRGLGSLHELRCDATKGGERSEDRSLMEGSDEVDSTWGLLVFISSATLERVKRRAKKLRLHIAQTR